MQENLTKSGDDLTKYRGDLTKLGVRSSRSLAWRGGCISCDSVLWTLDFNTDKEDKARIAEDTNEEKFELDELLKDGMSGDKTYIHFPKLPLTNVR